MENIIIDEERIYEVKIERTVIEFILGLNVWPFKAAAVKLIVDEKYKPRGRLYSLWSLYRMCCFVYGRDQDKERGSFLQQFISPEDG
jgi:hypothetical protein